MSETHLSLATGGTPEVSKVKVYATLMRRIDTAYWRATIVAIVKYQNFYQKAIINLIHCYTLCSIQLLMVCNFSIRLATELALDCNTPAKVTVEGMLNLIHYERPRWWLPKWSYQVEMGWYSANHTWSRKQCALNWNIGRQWSSRSRNQFTRGKFRYGRLWSMNRWHTLQAPSSRCIQNFSWWSCKFSFPICYCFSYE